MGLGLNRGNQASIDMHYHVESLRVLARWIVACLVTWCALALFGCWDSRTETVAKTKTAKQTTITKAHQEAVKLDDGSIKIVDLYDQTVEYEDENGNSYVIGTGHGEVSVPPAAAMLAGAAANIVLPGSGQLLQPPTASASKPKDDGIGGLMQAGMALLTAAGGTAAVVKHQQAKKAEYDADAAWSDAQHYAHHAPPGTPPPPSMGA